MTHQVVDRFGGTTVDLFLANQRLNPPNQLIVLVIDGRDFIIPLKAIYTLVYKRYIPVGDFVLPTTIYKSLKRLEDLFFRGEDRKCDHINFEICNFGSVQGSTLL